VSGAFTIDKADPSKASFSLTLKTASVDTNNKKRDEHLQSPDFFNAKQYPTITFKSTRIERKGDDAKIYGTLTIRDVTKDIVLDGHFNGIQKSSQGGDRVGFELGPGPDPPCCEGDCR